jgi:D-alanine-D-alanine ligase
MKVAVIYNTGVPRESDVVNLLGMRTRESYQPHMVERVAAALEKGGHDVRAIEGNVRVICELLDFMPRSASARPAGMVFNMAYGIQGQSRYTHVPALLEMLGVPYVGSAPAAHAVALDKVLTKIVFLYHGLPTPAFWVATDPVAVPAGVRYPAVVKPKMEAASFGVRVVANEAELRETVSKVKRDFAQAALVEEFIPGREFAVGVLGNGPDPETLPAVEIDLGGDPDAYQSYEIKMVQHPRKLCPAEVSDRTAAELRQMSRRAFDALGIFDFARVDFRMDASGRLYLLELNSMASLNLTGSFVKSAEVAGLDFDALVNQMLEVARRRYLDAGVEL